MAEPAGRVNDQAERTMLPLPRSSRSHPMHPGARTGGSRLDLRCAAATVEVVWPRQGSVGWGTGPKKFTEQFAYLMPFQRHVTLGFYHGGELPDPRGLLPEAGGRQVRGSLSMRSLRITSLEQLQEPALRTLIKAATVTGVPPVRE
jgi:hypothetical protein